MHIPLYFSVQEKDPPAGGMTTQEPTTAMHTMQCTYLWHPSCPEKQNITMQGRKNFLDEPCMDLVGTYVHETKLMLSYAHKGL